MADTERNLQLENQVWRIEQRQHDVLATLGEHKAHLERIDKQLTELSMKVQWLQWQQQKEHDQTKTLLPLAHQVAAVSSIDPALVRIVIGSLLAAVLGLAGGNLVLFGGY